uniref:Uncharacterized protein n=1 Tax=Chromera velia CCMP2878 TaxID=1169474 RepID=A0A0G4I734_9ALVE|mmetsp:Transcript_8857/g.17302  ORF Transcript_8857/g.17302 Transcript_8857/m.17302 type:complete len:181 (+) Transcript_8857:222-764(+)|eukprot:Cvel_1930.t1-p1 / transcript=Cvel_1930.t1 / gene=Cvel_1930 / organism=Chromera_velia_CCMP2878 / gene_product=hypothetical protein / transcript_product=hypothetical protein / location=Cvel_scaffold72:124072-126921(+) / protein_length=180 / sequence_SO=supercontig / SO=protein_coding / is_pseudo=false
MIYFFLLFCHILQSPISTFAQKPTGETALRGLQTAEETPLVIQNPGIESKADDPGTEKLEDSLQPLADFLQFNRDNNAAVRHTIDARNSYKLDPISTQINTARQAERDAVLGSADIAYFSGMDFLNALSGAPPQEYNTSDAPRQNDNLAVGLRVDQLRVPFRSSVNPFIDGFFGHPPSEN